MPVFHLVLSKLTSSDIPLRLVKQSNPYGWDLMQRIRRGV
jgi:hypothetical protein